jgi:hypothetical protein
MWKLAFDVITSIPFPTEDSERVVRFACFQTARSYLDYLKLERWAQAVASSGFTLTSPREGEEGSQQCQ